MNKFKDEQLIELSEQHNVAQFVSFSPGAIPSIRHSRIREYGFTPGYDDIRTSVEVLLQQSAGSVNIRSFRPDREKGNPFRYGISKADEAVSHVRSLAADGYFTIVNETVDTNDGGVSGVVLGGVMEFTPLDTPRGVEKPGAVSLPYSFGMNMLQTIYGFRPDVGSATGERVEFSIHPIRVGFRRTHTLLWEVGQVPPVELTANVFWPNRFSKFLGDKAYGLMIAHLLGLPVPATTVIPRAVAPFRFGVSTGTAEIWMRTCPSTQRPGHFPTTFGWEDPYTILARDDPEGFAISSVLAQESIDATYSGASLPGEPPDSDYIEGVRGHGDRFMLGEQSPELLPSTVMSDVKKMAAKAQRVLGPVRLEFAHDGHRAWVVQLHLASERYQAGVISPGTPGEGWIEFDAGDGLERLNQLIVQARAGGKGIRVISPVGLTSHVGDLLRKSGVPAEIRLRAGEFGSAVA